MMLYKNMKSVVRSSDGDADFFDIVAKFCKKIQSRHICL